MQMQQVREMRDGAGCRALKEDAARELVRGAKSEGAHDEDNHVTESSGHPSQFRH
jgi:hypothetical protein